MEKKHFIYVTINWVNGKIYVGQHTTKDIDDGYLGSGVVLWLALDKYGEECFTREILEFCTSGTVNEKERLWIKELKSNDPDIGYNLTEGGEGTTGYIHKPETLELFSKQRSGENHYNYGKPMSQTHRNSISKSLNGQVYTKERCENMSKGRTGMKFSSEHLKSLSKATAGKNNPMYGVHRYGKENPMYNKKHSPETTKRISEGVRRANEKKKLQQTS